jgi:hypothetical protein
VLEERVPEICRELDPSSIASTSMLGTERSNLASA